MTELTQLLQTSSHATFQHLLQQLLMPCIQTVSTFLQFPSPAQASTTPSAVPQKVPEGGEAAEDIQQRGRAWVMLGMLRLHLAAPPAGADPVGKYAYKKAHYDCMLTEHVQPETQVSCKHLSSVVQIVLCHTIDEQADVPTSGPQTGVSAHVHMQLYSSALCMSVVKAHCRHMLVVILHCAVCTCCQSRSSGLTCGQHE